MLYFYVDDNSWILTCLFKLQEGISQMIYKNQLKHNFLII